MKYTFKIQGNKEVNTDQNIIDLLQEGNDKTFKKFYLAELNPFISWILKQYPLDENQAKDLYQESQMLLYENIQLGKLTKLTGSLKTYLYSIAKNLIKVNYRKMVVTSEHEEKLSEHLLFLAGESKNELTQNKVASIRTALQSLGEPCLSLMTFFYYESLSFQLIAKRMGYKNESVAKNQKKRCLDRLRSMYQTSNHEIE